MPVGFDPFAGSLQRLGLQLDFVSASALGAANEPRPLEHPKVAGNCGGGNSERLRQPANVGLAAHEPLEDAPPRRIGERRKDVVEGCRTINHCVKYSPGRRGGQGVLCKLQVTKFP